MRIDELIQKKPDERVIFYIRRHLIIFFGILLLIVFMAAIPLAAIYGVLTYYPQMFDRPLIGPAIKLAASAYFFWVWLFFFSNFVDYYLDAWIVTNDRILNVEQKGLFNRVVSELDMSKIQDVTSEVKGVLPFIFGYGDVYIQTAAEKERFKFEQVPKPEEVRKRLLLLVEEDRKRQGEVLLGMRGEA